ncbi:hypothetical protein GF386_02245 [Candidatus Pacearchaeota archaeon]|nr:hypothetical protein [Candidatus Pacearchaeota archaeon]
MKKRNFIFIALALLLILIINYFLLEKTITGYHSGEVYIDLGGFQLNIHSPENRTYNFTMNDSYPLDLNVSAEGSVENWWYTLVDLKHGWIVYENVSFTPNSSINASRWSNKLMVYANDSLGRVFNASVYFYIHVNNSAPLIGNLSDEYFACEKGGFSTTFWADDSDEDNLLSGLNPQYPTSPFFIDSGSRYNLTRIIYEIFSGTLSKDDAGGPYSGWHTYPENVSVDDNEYADSKSLNITVIAVNNEPEVEHISVRTLWTTGENSSFYYQVRANDTEDFIYDVSNSSEFYNYTGNLTFNVSFSNSSCRLFNISDNGIINYTANESGLCGNSSSYFHSIEICAIDNGLSNPHPNVSLCSAYGSPFSEQGCVNFSLTVTNENRAPVIISYYPLSLIFNAEGTTRLCFNITKYDPDGPAIDTYWYAGDSLKEYDAYVPGQNYDEFCYSFGCGVSGVFPIKSEITDGLLNDSVQWNISISHVPCETPGGGGGGGISIHCEEKWGCEVWSKCMNLEEAVNIGNISSVYELLIRSRCDLFDWNKKSCGYQIRNCTDLNHCGTNETKPGVIRECFFTREPNCNDGIQNCHHGACEVLVDCGGPCKPCPTCSDGIQNQGEKGIDCGGPCPPCIREIPVPISIKTVLIFSFFIMFILAIIFVIIMMIRYSKTRKIYERIAKKKSILASQYSKSKSDSKDSAKNLKNNKQ